MTILWDLALTYAGISVIAFGLLLAALLLAKRQVPQPAQKSLGREPVMGGCAGRRTPKPGCKRNNSLASLVTPAKSSPVLSPAGGRSQ